jgi:drug/metabolite transporter (DMT)-like permease
MNTTSPTGPPSTVAKGTTTTTTTTTNNVNNTIANNNQKLPPNLTVTTTYAGFYVLSGCSQPLIMTLCKAAGLADSSTQLYMMFYYLGPASVILPLIWNNYHTNNKRSNTAEPWPSRRTISKACCIALWDIMSSSMNYTGAGLAGPTIFAIVYSSVTIWTALFSRLFLARIMNKWQWMAVLVVFGGLTLTATDSLQMGHDVVQGLILILVGSMMHALTYVMSEAIMTVGEEQMSIRQNCAVQGLVAFGAFFFWQLVYTLPRWDEKIGEPLRVAETSVVAALAILFSFSLANLVHAITFFHTLRHYPGGATSAGVMKGLQAVLVFVFTHFIYCGRMGGEEMCFTQGKLLALGTVTGGVLGYGIATQERERSGRTADYERINEVATGSVEIEPLIINQA